MSDVGFLGIPEPGEVDPVAESARIGRAFTDARRELRRRTGTFLDNAANEDELIQRLAMRDMDRAIAEVAEQYLSEVSDSKAKLARSMVREWAEKRAARTAEYDAKGDKVDDMDAYSDTGETSWAAENGRDEAANEKVEWGERPTSGEPALAGVRVASVDGEVPQRYADKWDSQENRDKAKSEGDTFPGTDKFPIQSCQDVEDARSLIGRTNLPHDKVRAYIDRKAKELGCGSKEQS